MRIAFTGCLWLEVAQALFAKDRRRIVTTSATTRPNDSGRTPHYFVETRCDAQKRNAIIYAWAEAKQLAGAHITFRPGYHYHIPHTQWLGKDWDVKGSRLARLFNERAQPDDDVYWYCNDYAAQCSDGVYAYSWDSSGVFGPSHHTVFCDPFFLRKNLSDLMVMYSNDKHQQKIMENFHLSKGQIMLQQIWHYQNPVSHPHTGDYACHAQATWDLARDQRMDPTHINAGSYALDAVAIYVQQYYRSSMSPIPFLEFIKLDPSIAAKLPEPTADYAVAKTFDRIPPGWNGPLVTVNHPDLKCLGRVVLDVNALLRLTCANAGLLRRATLVLRQLHDDHG